MIGIAIFYNGVIGYGITGIACAHMKGFEMFGEAANDGDTD